MSELCSVNGADIDYEYIGPSDYPTGLKLSIAGTIVTIETQDFELLEAFSRLDCLQAATCFSCIDDLIVECIERSYR